jgi:eukaryotic-like serine/threonine-protein kinase
VAARAEFHRAPPAWGGLLTRTFEHKIDSDGGNLPRVDVKCYANLQPSATLAETQGILLNQPTPDRFSTTPETGREFACPDCGWCTGGAAAFCPFDGVPLAPTARDGAGERSAQHGFDVGRRIGERYRLLALLGSGGTALVFRALDEQRGVHVAVKVLRPKFLHDHHVAAGFLEEARATRDVAHPNVCAVHATGHIDGRLPFLVMDVCDGRPLTFWLAHRCREAAPQPWVAAAAQRRPLSTLAIASIVEQVASGVAALHARGWVHRDLKPENLMVARYPFEWRVRIVDFGLAAALRAGARESAIAYGTPAYMSPEQASGSALDCRSDLYSMGVVLYQLLKGRLPFEAETDVGMLSHHLNTPLPEHARDRRQGLRAQLEHVALRCLEKDPARRYRSAAAMSSDLRAAQRLPLRSERASALSNPLFARRLRAKSLVRVMVSPRSFVIEGGARI